MIFLVVCACLPSFLQFNPSRDSASISEIQTRNKLLMSTLGPEIWPWGSTIICAKVYSNQILDILCACFQEIMHDPVTAGDGYTYER